VAIFGFIGNWNNFLTPLIYLRSQELYTLALGLNLFRGQFVTYYNQMMAVSLLALAPILIVFFFTQKQFIQGIALTGIKG
jgi:ABC-type glycerol-3-phosphate transport system permease component